ncbi:MAG TPA: Gfo/Idh/MocA family oxidoreductase [Candidatus Brocadiia bacterium]|nr:Gfo/Idh/MocA family oxidoreductase [Candidatus Brocadiia bacterium]
MRTAVIGASGIGKHHCKWITKLGGSVEAVVGRTKETVGATGIALKESLGIEPALYKDAGKMLRKVSPELVIVATPPELHETFAAEALRAGAHVLCEKPPLWDDSADADSMMKRLDALYAIADENSRTLLFVGQYRYLQPHLPVPMKHFGMRFEVRRARPIVELWIDLAYHVFVGLGTLVRPNEAGCDVDSMKIRNRTEQGADIVLDLTVGKSERVVRMELQLAGGYMKPQRWISIDDARMDIGGRELDGEYHTTLTDADGAEIVIEDLLKQEVVNTLKILANPDPAELLARRSVDRTAMMLLVNTCERLKQLA